MNTKKFILFNLVQTIVLMVFTYKSFFKGFENETILSFLNSNILVLGIIGTLLLITLFVNISFIVPQVIRKKNLLKIAFLFQLVLVIYSIYLLFTQQVIINVILTIMLLIGLIVKYIILKNLYTLVRSIFLKKHTQ